MRRSLTVVSMALLVAVALLPSAGSAQEPPCDGDFYIVHQLLKTDEQNDIDFAPDGEGWTVGSQVKNPDSGDPTHKPLAVRFDQAGFRRMTPPSARNVNVELSGLEVVTSNDVYAVGYAYSGALRTTGVAYHRDADGWTKLDVPTPGKLSWLREIVAVSPTELWAVGEWQRRDSEAFETLVLRYDGEIWRKVPAPSPGKRYAALHDVDATGPNDAWAVGSWGNRHPLVIKWNGTEWTRDRMSNVDFADGEAFFGVDAVSPTEVWAVGDGLNEGLAVHLDGGQWVRTTFPDVDREPELNEVAAEGSQAWVAGRWKIRSATFGLFAARWENDGWVEVGVEGREFEGYEVGDLDSVALDPTGNVWAVGDHQASEDRYDIQEVIEKACV